MLFIYDALPVGGIETFFVRMAKERFSKGLFTAILLQSKPEVSDPELLAEMKKYAEVYFVEDFFVSLPGLTRRFPLLAPVKTKKVKRLLEKITQIHVFDGMHALLGYRLSALCNKQLPVTIGFYHYIKYVWGGDNVAYHERLNRKFIFEYLPEKSLLFFSQGNRNFYTRHKKLDFKESNVFRLGVVDAKDVKVSGWVNARLKICAVGRLVEFKTYNLYMLDVIKSLLDKGVDVTFDIYGDGPLQKIMEEKIKSLGLADHVCLKGTLNYSEFDDTVASYDLFIGSGTAIIQAAGLGVPSIAAVENMQQPETYGFFSEVHQHEYNLKGLDIPLYNVETLILDYINFSDEQRLALKRKHLDSMQEFTNETCQDSMDKLKGIEMPQQPFKYNRWFYEASRILDRLHMKFDKNHGFNRRHRDFKR